MDTNSKSHVHALFETIAPKYDFMNDVISFRRHKAWRKYTMYKMNVQKGQNALDICCGTADWTIDLARASETGHIIGLDFSQNMLNVGAEKVAREALGRQIELVQGNAMNLPYEDNTFDYVTSVSDYVMFQIICKCCVKCIVSLSRVEKSSAWNFRNQHGNHSKASTIFILNELCHFSAR